MSNNRYIQDESLEEGYRDQGLLSFKNIAIGSAIAAGSMFAYKSGAMQKGIKKAIEKVSGSRPLPFVAMNDLRSWLNSDFEAPAKSVFRLGVMGSIKEISGATPKRAYNVFKDTKDFRNTTKAMFDVNKPRQVYGDTLADLNEYGQRLNYSIQNLTASKIGKQNIIYNTAHNTDILREIKHINNATDLYSDNFKVGKRAMKSKMHESIIGRFIQSADDAAKQIKRTGFRKAEIDDLFHISRDNNGKIRLIAKENTGYDFSSHGKETAISEIEDILNSKVVNESGLNITNKDGKDLLNFEKHENFKHMTIDKNILIDKNNKIVDIRDQKRSASEFINNLATDWEIPVIKINPLRMFGVDKIGKNSVSYGSIAEDTVAPFLTGVRGNTKNETISALKDKVDRLKGVREGVTIIDGDVYRMSDNGSGITKMDYKSKKRLIEVPERLDGGTSALTPTENSVRKMGGLTYKHFEDYKIEDGKFKFYKQKVAKWLDIGYQERKRGFDQSGFSIFEDTNPDSFVGNVLNKLSPEPYKTATEIKTFSGMSTPMNNAGHRKNSFFVMNKAHRFGDIVEVDKEAIKNTFKNIKGSKKVENNMKDIVKFDSEKLNSFVTQFGKTFSNETFEDINSATGLPYFILERMNQTLGSVGLALSNESTKDTISTAKNLIMKRFMPVYLGYRAWDAVNMIGEDNHEEPSTIQQRMIKAYSRFDIGMHKIGEKLGVSKVFKNLSEITPGSDMIGEIPGVNMLNLDDTEEDRREYWESGYKPVRKGRFWSLNTTPFVGGKVQYHRANALRTSMADAKYSDSMYGSRKERLVNILDRNHYDEKHYYTRPYMMTSPGFENVPIVGPLLSSTIGRVIAPQRKMHEEYWNGDTPKSLQEVREMEQREQVKEPPKYMESYNTLTSKSKAKAEILYSKTKETFANIFGFGIDKENNTRFDINSIPGVIGPSDNYNMYRTNSGSLSVVNLGDKNFNPRVIINQDGGGLGQVINAREEYSIDEGITDEMVEDEMFKDPTNPFTIGNVLEDQLVDTFNVAGIYGFATSGFVTGSPGQSEARIETSGYSRSFNKEFIDSEFGGFGGDLSEIFRRLVQGRRKDQKYYNPIRNRMPEYLPGREGFIDLKHGDAYSKIAHGEERLPGEGFERLHGIDMEDRLKFGMDSKNIGKTKEEMLNAFMNVDIVTDKNKHKEKSVESSFARKVKEDMFNQKIALEKDIFIEDKENNISGTADLMVNDDTSKTNTAIMNLKSVSDSEFKNIVRTKTALDEDYRNVNWMLKASNQDNGYVHYINRDNPDQSYTSKIKYNRKIYNSTMETVKSSREEMNYMLNSGKISRGDLYTPLEKYKLLADVAPYSDQYMEMNKVISNMKWSEEETKEITKIRERVTEQKEPLRLYDYRFKKNETETHKVEILSKIDNEKFNISGFDSPIKLAGVNIKKDNPNYNEAVAFLNKHLSEGENVRIEIAKDELKRNNKDMFNSMNAVVYSNGKNINRELIEREYAEEDEKDFSAAGVKARFNKIERGFGKAWETFAHIDSFAHTKLLQVRSASEDYQRKQVYDKEFKEWQDPIDDFLKPAIWSNINRTGGVFLGAGVGYLLGSSKSSYGKLVGAFVGGMTILGGKMYKSAYEKKTGERWVPEEKRKERELNDYMDKIKFVKNRRLFEVYSEKALKEDGIDVKKMITDNEKAGSSRKEKARELNKIKTNDKKYGTFSKEKYEELGVDFKTEDKLPSILREMFIKGKETVNEFIEKLPFPFKRGMERTGEYINKYNVDSAFNEETRDEMSRPKEKKLDNLIDSTKKIFKGKASKIFDRISNVGDDYNSLKNDKKASMWKTVNEEINEKTSSKATFETSDNAMKAMHYYNESEKTMYGYDQGEQLNNFISALPKKDRQYFRKFMEAPEDEREDILSVAPKYMKRALQAVYKKPVDEKESLDSYFKEHYLPGEEWDGWREGYDLNSMKVKMIQQQNMELGSFDMWEQDKEKADMYGNNAPLPNMNYKTKDLTVVKEKLSSILGSSGYSDLSFSYGFTKGPSNINLNMAEGLEQRFNEKLNERLEIR